MQRFRSVLIPPVLSIELSDLLLFQHSGSSLSALYHFTKSFAMLIKMLKAFYSLISYLLFLNIYPPLQFSFLAFYSNYCSRPLNILNPSIMVFLSVLQCIHPPAFYFSFKTFKVSLVQSSTPVMTIDPFITPFILKCHTQFQKGDVMRIPS